ncbi:SWT1 RNA endoribonuclease-like protein [Amazona aestiva]|uniref:SWT1 RNA endoribonuclease-like protein n=1 Tax=Amazona aestiva TaxID=12930 RepID=A0A0Q3TZV4_AMAAE|nr:SWT1 RNA endoribonuclease-like protein [Amazona aestiva]
MNKKSGEGYLIEYLRIFARLSLLGFYAVKADGFLIEAAVEGFKVNRSMKFTAEELYECVSQEVYRKRLEIGCCQLVQLEHTIKQCHESVQTEAKNRGWL